MKLYVEKELNRQMGGEIECSMQTKQVLTCTKVLIENRENMVSGKT